MKTISGFTSAYVKHFLGMRIGIVTEYHRPWPGGIAEHVHHEARELQRLGHQVVVITGPRSRTPDDDDVAVERLGRAIRFTSNGAASQMVVGSSLLNLRRRFRRLGLDVLHVHAPLDPVLPLAAVLASEVPVVGTFHASFDRGPLWDVLYRRASPLFGAAFRRLAVRIAVSDEARRSIAAYFPGGYDIVPNGVDVERFQRDLPPPPGALAGATQVLFVGRSDPRKGLPLLLQAWPGLLARVPDACLLVIAGRGGDAARQLVRAAPGCAAVRVLDYVPPALIPCYFAHATALCSPATGGESHGIVLLEAMASGCPPVVFDIPGYRDTVTHGVDGWLAGAPSSAHLTEALAIVLLDLALRARLRDGGARTAARHHWREVVRAIDARLSAAASGNRRE